MVTGHQAGRERFARVAVRSFQAQTYQPRELVILNQSLGLPQTYRILADEFFQHPHIGEYKAKDYTIREIMAPTAKTLGDARNQTLEMARGEWMLPWDDDDFSHPDRITQQMARRNGQRAVVPTNYICYSFPNNTAYVQRHRWCSGLMLFPRTDWRYEPKPSSEDWSLMELFPDRIRWENPSHLYIRSYHGENTWDERHVMGRFKGVVGQWILMTPQQDYLRSVLSEYYPWAKMGTHK